MWYAGGYRIGMQGLQIGYASANAIPPITTVVSTTASGIITDTSDLTTTIEILAAAVTDTTTIVYTSLPTVTVTPSPTLAFAGHASFYRSGESALGPIQITIKGDVSKVIDYLCGSGSKSR